MGFGSGAVGEAFVVVRPDTHGFAAEAESGIGQPMRRLVGSIAAMFAAVQVKQWIQGWIAEAQESIKVEAQTAAAIKSTGGAANVTAGQVGAYATKLSLLSGVDDELIQKGSNMLLTFTNIHNEVGKGNDIFNQATSAALDMSAALGQDVTASALQLGKALNDPINGVTALRRVGVQLTDEQKAQIEAFVKSGDVMSAQKIILGELTKEFGGSAAAQATATDRMKVMWDNLRESLGKAILPAINELFPAFEGAIKTLAPIVQPAAKMIGEVLAKAFKVLMPAIQTLLPVLAKLFPVVMDLFGAFAPLVPAVAELSAALVSALIPIIQAMIPVLEPLIAALAQVMTELAKSGVLMELSQAFVALIQAIMPLVPVLVQVIEFMTPIISTAVELASILINVLAVAISTLMSIAVGAWHAISSAFSFMYGVMSSVWKAIKTVVIDPLIGGITTAWSTGVQAWDAVKGGFQAMYGVLKAAWDKINKYVIQPMLSALHAVISAIETVTSFGSNPTSPQAPRKPGSSPPGYSGVSGKPSAVGGPREGLISVGEIGTELLHVPGGSYVYPHNRTAEILSRAMNVTVDAASLDRAARMLLAAAQLFLSMNVSQYDAVTIARIG